MSHTTRKQRTERHEQSRAAKRERTERVTSGALRIVGTVRERSSDTERSTFRVFFADGSEDFAELDTNEAQSWS